MLFITLASGQGTGWGIAVLLVLVAKWGWLAGLASLAALIPLRSTRNPWVAFLLVGVLIIGMILFAVSIVLLVWILLSPKR
jgi:hypothetical protein